MGVMAGYKQTEVGVIPVDWEFRSLDSLGKRARPAIKAGPFGSSLTKDTYVVEGYKVYGQEQVIRSDYLFGDYFISKARFNELKSCAVEPGDILLSLVGTAGRVLVIPQGAPEGVINPRLIRFSFDRDIVSPRFFQALLETDTYQAILARSAQGGTMGVLNAGLLRPLCIPLPPVAEQEAIAKAITDTDALIESLEQLIVKKRHIKQGAMQELLSGRKRLPGFSGQWLVKTYGEIFNYHSTATNPRNDLSVGGDTYYIHYGDIHTKFHSHLDFRRNKPPRIERRCCRNATLLQNGDWIMADASEDFDGIGKSIEISGLEEGVKAVAGLHTFLLREKEPIFAPAFKGHLGNLHSLHEEFLRVATGMKVFGVSKTALKNLTLPVPSQAEQTAIATILSDMDSEIASLEYKLFKYRQIKQGMMHNLLTGKIRLV